MLKIINGTSWNCGTISKSLTQRCWNHRRKGGRNLRKNIQRNNGQEKKKERKALTSPDSWGGRRRKEIMAEIFPYLVKDISIQIQESANPDNKFKEKHTLANQSQTTEKHKEKP